VTRRALLDWARDTGRGHTVRPVTLDELRSRPAFWVSSLSLAVPIHTIDGVDVPRADELVAEFSAALRRG
jgi:branched-subunit amino acid aminotransferase/4-amino-4-deoxychorismate lyase